MKENYVITSLAIAVNIFSCGLNALSFAFMKKAHKQIEKNPNKSVYLNICWLSGLFVLIVGNLLSVATLPYIGVVLLSTMSAMTILFNAITSIKLNGEQFTRLDLLAFILICSGTILCISHSNMEQVDYSSEQLLKLLFHEKASAWFFAYMFLGMIVSVASLKFLLPEVSSFAKEI
mmetsp:Transcript_34162/g.24681  ORF Transcript_34162/g.24681 Transcript_34162/m.24681 type:complete len:176 (+) Transcript_34162:19-546(+)